MARTPVQDQLKAGIRDLQQGLGAGGTTKGAGEAVRKWVIKRTDLGRDVRLQRFTAYAQSTRKIKRRKGQRLQPVSLRDTEEMLEAMEVVPQQRSWGTQVIEAVIRFRGRRNSNLARIHSDPETSRTKIPLREFFGMEDTDPEAASIGKQFGISAHAKIKQDRRTSVTLTIFRARKTGF